jgi:hypothetical protein
MIYRGKIEGGRYALHPDTGRRCATRIDDKSLRLWRGRFLFLAPLVETFEDMLAVERYGLPCVGDSQRVCLDRDTDVSFFLVMDKSVFQQVGDE